MTDAQHPPAIPRYERSINEADAFNLTVILVSEHAIPALTFGLLYKSSEKLHRLWQIAFEVFIKIMTLTRPLLEQITPTTVNMR